MPNTETPSHNVVTIDVMHLSGKEGSGSEINDQISIELRLHDDMGDERLLKRFTLEMPNIKTHYTMTHSRKMLRCAEISQALRALNQAPRNSRWSIVSRHRSFPATKGLNSAPNW